MWRLLAGSGFVFFFVAVGIFQEIVIRVRSGHDYDFDVDNAYPENFVLRIAVHTRGGDDMREDFFDYIDTEERMI